MKQIKLLILSLIVPILLSATHKFYVSITQINYIEKEQSVQITSRIFIDDLEQALRKYYDENVTLAIKNEPEIIDVFINKYLKKSIAIKINGKTVDYTFLGKEYDNDVVICYIEIKNISCITSFEISNQLLFDLYSEQQNIIKTNINSEHQSFILIPNNEKAVVTF